jgi:multiple sugar transport system substrate-binding protein
MTRNQLILIGIGLLAVLSLVLLFVFGGKETGNQLSGQLTFWGVFDSPAVMQNLISAYQQRQPGVEITYRQLNPATYENDLVNALAGVNPPDLFMFHNTWLPKHFNKVTPFSGEQISVSRLRNLFPTVVEQDFAPDGTVYALPLYIDTLAMFYNQDIFDGKGVALAPKDWAEFEAAVPKLRTLDRLGRIQKPAAAIGGSNKSINRATDILQLVMLQAGTQMVDENFSQALFGSQQGREAFSFYTKFANPLDPAYTWNDSLAYSLDSFAAGDTAIMFNYSHQVAFLKEKNPFLNFRVTSMLQPREKTQDVNFANYWGVAASNKTPGIAAAQDFILFLTTDPQAAQTYLQLTGRPPALRGLINQYLNDPELGVFARQALTARSWPQIDNAAIENIFSTAISDVLAGRLDNRRALDEAAGKVTELMRTRVR